MTDAVKVLIADDEPTMLSLMSSILEARGDCRLSLATNGEEALSAVATNDIDLVLTDFNLPDMTGPAVVRALRQLSDRLANIPCIMLTAFDGYEHRFGGGSWL